MLFWTEDFVVKLREVDMRVAASFLHSNYAEAQSEELIDSHRPRRKVEGATLQFCFSGDGARNGMSGLPASAIFIKSRKIGAV